MCVQACLLFADLPPSSLPLLVFRKDGAWNTTYNSFVLDCRGFPHHFFSGTCSNLLWQNSTLKR
ncbi:hypothetical protein CW304_28755 [Bacillus sp. UFRGS-B20]|nr:hypothetical protein CW304_28755 [Bacillus sp. UFRGS-B20]